MREFARSRLTFQHDQVSALRRCGPMPDLSVVIRCGNDPNVLRCIASVDVQAEIVVAFTGSSQLAESIKKTGARCVPTPRGNLSQVSNMGFEAAKGSRVILTDSDTEFEPGCIQRLHRALETSKVARARIRFEVTGAGLGSRVAAEARDYVNSLPVVFTPGIAVRRDLVSDVGGILFNDPVPYAVDADLDLRIKRAHVPVAFVQDAWVRHSAIPLRHDVRAAYRIGAGCRVSIDHWNRDGRFGQLAFNELKAVRFRHLSDLLRRKGPATLAYQTVWDCAYWFGYEHQHERDHGTLSRVGGNFHAEQ